MTIAANLSMLFTETDMLSRFEAARRAGFDAVEIQFPDEEPDLDALRRAADEAGLPVALINVPRGGPDMAGLAALPGRETDFAAAVERGRAVARALGARKANVLSGFTTGLDPASCRNTLIANLRLAAEAFGDDGVRLMVEPVNPHDVPGFHLTGLQAGLDVIGQVSHPNLALQFDFYHMAVTEDDLPTAIRRAGALIGHVQFADAPGRAQPGSGALGFAAAFEALAETGYTGTISAEYRPPAGIDTADTLDWMQRFKEMTTWSTTI